MHQDPKKMNEDFKKERIILYMSFKLNVSFYWDYFPPMLKYRYGCYRGVYCDSVPHYVLVVLDGHLR